MMDGVHFVCWFIAFGGRSTYIQTASATLPSLPSMHRLRSSSSVINLVTLEDRTLAASDPDFLRTDAVTATRFLSGLSDSLFVRIRS